MDIYVIGGGAAGIAAAITLKRNSSFNVVILEQLDKIGKKILASGNGKANISNSVIKKEFYSNEEFIERINDNMLVNNLFDYCNILTKSDDEGRIYPYTLSSKTVLDAFLVKLKELNVKVITNYTVTSIKKNDNKFVINNEFYCDKVILATGGKSQKALGSTGIGYELLKEFTHHITPLTPSLCPLYSIDTIKSSLSGKRFKCEITCGDFKEKGEMIFKDDGLSGIVIFNLISYILKNNSPKKEFLVDFFPTISKEHLLEFFKEIKNNSTSFIDEAFVGTVDSTLFRNVLEKGNFSFKKRKVNTLLDEELLRLVSLFKECSITFTKPYPFESSQVTHGGLCLEEIKDSFESKKVPNLYVIGELLNIDGKSGGYNLHFAFLSGIIAGLNII